MAMLSPYQAALLLNNTSIALLKLRRFREAVITIKDALDLLKEITSSVSNPQTAPKPEFVNECLQRAASCLVPSNSPGSGADYPPVHTISLGHWNQEQLNRDDLFSDAVDFVVQLDVEQAEERRNLDLDSAVVLFNYGVACRCCLDYSNGVGAREEQSLLDASVKFFALSRDILRREFEAINSDSVSEDKYESELVETMRIVLLSVLSTRCLGSVALAMDMGQHFQSYVEELQNLYSIYLQLKLRVRRAEHLISSVAAAAA